MMAPFARFTHSKATGNVRDSRRKRWSETYGRFLLGLGVLLQFLQSRDVVVLFPAAWHPYIAGASAMLALVVGSDSIERARDLKRANKRWQRSPQDTPP